MSMSKWIEEMEKIFLSNEDTDLGFNECLSVAFRIDELLRRARANTNNEELYEEIDREIRGAE